MKSGKAARILLVVVGLTASLPWMGCGKMPDVWEGMPEPRVLSSFPPIQCFVQNVAGDNAGMLCLCTGTGPHDYQFSINDTVKLREAHVFFANGLGLDDHFTDKMVTNSGNPHLLYRELAESVPDNLRKKGEAHEESDHGHHHHHHGEFDPHVWLGIPQAKKMVEQIRDDLKKVKPAHAGTYDANTTRYLATLDKLHKDGRTQLEKLRGVPVVTFHESMAYFADSFGLHVIGAIQPSPGIDPDAQNLRDIIEKCRNKPRVIVTVEPQYPKKAAEDLKKELGKAGVKEVALVEIDPLETCDSDDLTPDWYERRMRENIKNLAGHAK